MKTEETEILADAIVETDMIKNCEYVGSLLMEIDEIVRKLKKVPGIRRIDSVFELETSLHRTIYDYEKKSQSICKSYVKQK